MSGQSPTRSAVIELKDERRAMHEGYAFLDEKCLLLAGEILRQLRLLEHLQGTMDAAQAAARIALQAALARHGLQELQVYPVADGTGAALAIRPSTLMGVRLQQATLEGMDATAAAAVNQSPEAEACRAAFVAVLNGAAPLSAVCGNLERLSAEYRRSVRRARALQDVMLPEVDRSIADFEGRLEELEQEDAIWMRQGTRPA